MTYTVGHKGQIVIEKSIRDALGIEPGWTAIQYLVDDHVEVYFIPPEHNKSLFGVLAPFTSVSVPDEDALHEAIEESRAAEVRERWGATGHLVRE